MGDLLSKLRAFYENADTDECLGDIRDAIEELERLYAERRWIPVSEEVPEDNTDVLVSVDENSDDCGLHVCEYYDGKFRRSEAGCIWGVTHWMPMPEPPTD